MTRAAPHSGGAGGDDVIVASYVQRVVLPWGQLLPAGGAAVRRSQCVSHTLAAEDVTAAGRHHQPAALRNLKHRDTRAIRRQRFGSPACPQAVKQKPVDSPLSRSPDKPDN